MTPLQYLRGRLVAQTDAAWCIGQPDTDGGATWWLPRSEVRLVERHEHVAQAIVILTAPVWLVAEKHCGILLHDPGAQSAQTLSLPGF